MGREPEDVQNAQKTIKIYIERKKGKKEIKEGARRKDLPYSCICRISSVKMVILPEAESKSQWYYS